MGALLTWRSDSLSHSPLQLCMQWHHQLERLCSLCWTDQRTLCCSIGLAKCLDLWPGRQQSPEAMQTAAAIAMKLYMCVFRRIHAKGSRSILRLGFMQKEVVVHYARSHGRLSMRVRRSSSFRFYHGPAIHTLMLHRRKTSSKPYPSFPHLDIILQLVLRIGHKFRSPVYQVQWQRLPWNKAVSNRFMICSIHSYCAIGPTFSPCLASILSKGLTSPNRYGQTRAFSTARLVYMMHADVSAAYLEPCRSVPLSTSALDAVALPIGTSSFSILERSRIFKTHLISLLAPDCGNNFWKPCKYELKP